MRLFFDQKRRCFSLVSVVSSAESWNDGGSARHAIRLNFGVHLHHELFFCMEPLIISELLPWLEVR